MIGEAVEQARSALLEALIYAGNVIIGNLDGATDTDRAEADRALEEAKLRGITLSTLLAEQGSVTVPDSAPDVRGRIMAKHGEELDAWRQTQVDQPALSDAEFDAAQRANWLDSARQYDPNASLDDAGTDD